VTQWKYMRNRCNEKKPHSTEKHAEFELVAFAYHILRPWSCRSSRKDLYPEKNRFHRSIITHYTICWTSKVHKVRLQVWLTAWVVLYELHTFFLIQKPSEYTYVLFQLMHFTFILTNSRFTALSVHLKKKFHQNDYPYTHVLNIL